MITDILRDIPNARKYITKLQEEIGDSDVELKPADLEIIDYLAFDLDYYQPNEKFRDECYPVLFGEDKLILEIEEALKKLSK